MTRALPLAAAALLVVVACSAPDTPRASSTPAPVLPPAAPQAVAVHVQVPEPAEPAVVAWAQELEAAITSGQGGLVLAPTAEEATAVVRVDAVEAGVKEDPDPEGEGEVHVMRGALVVGESARAFNLVYRGDARPQAEALARNLRRFAAEGGAVVPAPEQAEPEETEAETGDQG